jgi:sigma-B regulation protein RsbU (phosphoserine phosphatase)
MKLISLELESKLRTRGMWPGSRTAWAALYVVALDVLVFAVQLVARQLKLAMASSLTGWVGFLSLFAIILLGLVALRWLRAHLLWRLRNRLIVTYVFIGVIPVVLLVAISGIALYLFAGQFASFVVTSDIGTHLRSMEASNRAIARSILNQLGGGGKIAAATVDLARPRRPEWTRRQVCAWYRDQQIGSCAGPAGAPAFQSPSFINGDFRDIVRDGGRLYLRVATVSTEEPESLRVLTSEPLDKNLIDDIAGNLGQITIYATPTSAAAETKAGGSGLIFDSERKERIEMGGPNGPVVTENNWNLGKTFVSGTLPPAVNSFDRQVSFPIPLQVVDWATGERQRAGALAWVETRPSILYARLFAVLGDYAKGVEYILFSIALVFAAIEALALWIGSKLTRSITSSVADLYEATMHVNRGDFSHRITVKSNDQLAALGNSFNSMTTSIERLVLEQKEKQRLENELAIAQEVQEQLFPKEISQLESLEVHGFCRPARTVSGDYYDFLKLTHEKMILAVGDISGKGISAALMMATIHAAVRAYSLEGVPLLSEMAAVGSAGSGRGLISGVTGVEISPAMLLGLLNQQLYESTPEAKYATLFLGIYDGAARRLTYANGGHLPPILISEDGEARLLDCGGTVVGLLDKVNFPEATVKLTPGDLLVAYTDGVTEPESDYGEFGEERLIQIVRENRNLPLDRITTLVTAALDEWIGDKEQPDDVTLVLARSR